ncbi:serine/threonine-protein kinase ICK isoform X2 [Ciona intestinalis]
MHKYRILGKKGEGTFSEVLKCQHVKDGTYYACKKMKQHYDGVDQVNNLREIQAMRRLNPHANIIGLHEIIYDKKTGTVALICELMDMNIYELIRGRRHYVPEPKVKSYMYQLLKSLDHMHRCGIFHRDVKPENILIKDDVLKLADFGSCRSVYSKQPYTEYISTRWYRAPECLLTDGYYTYRMDLWSVGCVLFEVMSLHPLFPGANEVDQISKIHDVLGTPDASILNKMKHRNRGINFDFPQKKGTGIEKLLPHASQQCIELIYKMCTYDPDERITAKQALRHPYFRDIREAEKRAQEAQQMSRYNEAGSVKAGPGSNAGDVPIWKQNQIQKKRQRISATERLYKPLQDSSSFIEKSSKSKQEEIWQNRRNASKQKRVQFSAVVKRQSKVAICKAVTGAFDSDQDLTKLSKKGSKMQWKNKPVTEVVPQKKSSNTKSSTNSSKSTVQKKGVFKKEGSPKNSEVVKKKSSTVVKKQKEKLRKPMFPEITPCRKEITVLNQRRQRRLVEQHQTHHQTLGGIGVHGNATTNAQGALPQLVPVNGTALHGNSTFGGNSKPVFPSTTLPKVHLPHHHQPTTNSLLPGILKANMMQPKALHKPKIKPSEPTKSMYGHYQLPSINRHIYHH